MGGSAAHGASAPPTQGRPTPSSGKGLGLTLIRDWQWEGKGELAFGRAWSARRALAGATVGRQMSGEWCASPAGGRNKRHRQHPSPIHCCLSSSSVDVAHSKAPEPAHSRPSTSTDSSAFPWPTPRDTPIFTRASRQNATLNPKKEGLGGVVVGSAVKQPRTPPMLLNKGGCEEAADPLNPKP